MTQTTNLFLLEDLGRPLCDNLPEGRNSKIGPGCIEFPKAELGASWPWPTTSRGRQTGPAGREPRQSLTLGDRLVRAVDTIA